MKKWIRYGTSTKLIFYKLSVNCTNIDEQYSKSERLIRCNFSVPCHKCSENQNIQYLFKKNVLMCYASLFPIMNFISSMSTKLLNKISNLDAFILKIFNGSQPLMKIVLNSESYADVPTQW